MKMLNPYLVSPEIRKVHRQLNSLPKVTTFLQSIGRNSLSTAKGYKTALVYLQEFLSKDYNYDRYTIDSILPSLQVGETDVYKLLDEFVNFMYKQKKITPTSINQYLHAIRSYPSIS